MNCPGCGAPLRPVPHRDYLVCDHCTRFAFPKASEDGVEATGEASSLVCPVCAETLAYGRIEGHSVLHCPKCRGVMATQDTFGVMMRLLRAGSTSRDTEGVRPRTEEVGRRLACPYCSETMDCHPYYGPGDVIIDTCPDCAVLWLDHGEIARIRIAP